MQENITISSAVADKMHDAFCSIYGAEGVVCQVIDESNIFWILIVKVTLRMYGTT